MTPSTVLSKLLEKAGLYLLKWGRRLCLKAKLLFFACHFCIVEK